MENNFKKHRFPQEIIRYTVMLYYRYCLSLRDVSEILLYRGIELSYELIRDWSNKFGPIFTHNISKKRSFKPGDKWHMDEVRVVINKEVYWLWRAKDLK
jgi:putative transposase